MPPPSSPEHPSFANVASPPFPLDGPRHPHCLRHTTGTVQANGGMDAWRLQKLMGHASMANTTKYVAMSPEPLKDAWCGKR